MFRRFYSAASKLQEIENHLSIASNLKTLDVFYSKLPIETRQELVVVSKFLKIATIRPNRPLAKLI